MGAFSIRLACLLAIGIPHSLATVEAGNKVSPVGLRTEVENRTQPLLAAKADGTLEVERAARCWVVLLLVDTINRLKPLPWLSVKVTRPSLGD